MAISQTKIGCSLFFRQKFWGLFTRPRVRFGDLFIYSPFLFASKTKCDKPILFDDTHKTHYIAFILFLAVDFFRELGEICFQSALLLSVQDSSSNSKKPLVSSVLKLNSTKSGLNSSLPKYFSSSEKSISTSKLQTSSFLTLSSFG